MREWVKGVCDRVDDLASMDAEYRELNRQREALEEAYTNLLDRLCEEDRELLLEYMDVVGNMQYRMTQLAWLYGKLHPHDR